MPFKLARSTRLSIAIGISFAFFITEIAIGFKTHSIALIADAFHYLNDLISFIVALVAILISENGKTHRDLTFGWQRAQLLGAFFNGVFLLALGVSIFLQSLERFISLVPMEHPMLVVIVGAIGLALNIISITFLHEHDHGHDHGDKPGPVPLTVPCEPLSEEIGQINEIGMGSLDVVSETQLSDSEQTFIKLPTDHDHKEHRHRVSLAHNSSSSHAHHDYGMAGVVLHIVSDAINNVGVIIAGLIVWHTSAPHRFYVDPAVGLFIAAMILVSAVPLVKRTGHILLQSPPSGIDVADIKHDLEKIPGIVSVHELHVWRLNQKKALASAHIVIDDESLERFHGQAKTINECLHAYGVHSATIQPELSRRRASRLVPEAPPPQCQMNCGSVCEKMTCCG